ncbi:NUDIX domain-containing protein [Kocuria sp.]|uniref:NUDIX hydrolase n=1 Tax=Kocuria sp. TaxID=1871328 RepID=UPI0026DC14C3|nr:NUDIX domain-containing protein [Kocuria sp.]MDO4919002.1 NUDIX domain-containing protein [Kocuria sp.]
MSASHDALPTPAPSAADDAARPVIKVTGVVLRRTSDGHVLTVRKRGTRMFMFPGGKPEAGETPVETGIREVREELGVELTAADLTPVGEWHSDAANEPGHGLHSHVFLSTRPLTATPEPAAEIEELRWQPLDGVEDVPDLAPLARWDALPVVRGLGN